MNVVEPRLLPQDYPRANYLKREVEHARRYIVTAKLRGETGKAELLADFLEFAAGRFRIQTGNLTDDDGGTTDDPALDFGAP